MADKKLYAKQIAIAYAGATFTTVTTSAMFAQLVEWPMGYTVGWSWFAVVGLPSVVVAAESLAKALGKKTPVQIISNAGNQGRAVPINYGNGKQSHVYLSALTAPVRLIGGNNRQPEPAQPPMSIPQSFTVVIDDTPYQVPITDIRNFLHTAWQRQRQGLPVFSRTYWTKQKRPRMHPKEYQAMMLVLDQAQGAVINRGQGRSGKLALPPEATVKTLQGLM